MIRKIEWLDDPSPGCIGFFGIVLEEFRLLGDKSIALQKENDTKPKEDAQYQLKYMIDEAYSGRGLTTVRRVESRRIESLCLTQTSPHHVTVLYPISTLNDQPLYPS